MVNSPSPSYDVPLESPRAETATTAGPSAYSHPRPQHPSDTGSLPKFALFSLYPRSASSSLPRVQVDSEPDTRPLQLSSPPPSSVPSPKPPAWQPQATSSVRSHDILPYLQVLASSFFFLNSWGLINTFGTYQTFYTSALLSGTSNSSIAWIGSIRAFVLLFSPVFYGPVFDLGPVYVRLLAVYGTVCVAVGVICTSLCSQLWQFILAQGVLVGLGSGALFLVAVANLPMWWSEHRGVIMGFAAGGSSIGGVLYPVLFRVLEPHLGFGWALRIIGFVTLVTNGVGVAMLRGKDTSDADGKRKRRKIFDAALFKDVRFDVWSTAWLFGNMGLYIPYFFIQEYSNTVLGLSLSVAFWTLTTVNAASFFGRVGAGLLADRFGDPVLTITGVTAITTVLAFCWIAVRSSEAGIFVFSALYGFFSGGFVSLSTPATVKLAPSMDGLGTRLGVYNAIGSLGLLIGNPVAGALIMRSYTAMQIFAGCADVVALGFAVATILVVSRQKTNKLDEKC